MMIQCRECKKEVSSEAKTCPHCGCKRPAPITFEGVAYLILVCGGLGWWLFGSSPGKSAPPPPPHALVLTLPDTLDPSIKAVVTEAWPKVRRACPGLDKYAASLRFEGVEEAFRVDVLFRVPEDDKGIPAAYMAQGHRCAFEIDRKGAQLVVAKEGCKALCLDRVIKPGESLDEKDLVTSLK